MTIRSPRPERSSARSLLVLSATVATASLLATTSATHAQQGVIRLVQPAQPAQPIRMVPAQPSTLAPAAATSGAATAPPAMSPQELAQVQALYEALSPDEQQEMVAEYAARGIDLLALMAGESAGAPGDPTAAPPALPLLQLVLQRDFKRTPQTVLAARTALGLTATEPPAEDATSEVLATWLHTQVMAGEWDAFAWFLRERAGADADAIFAHVLQSTNQGDPLLLPEEVLAMADAAPGVPTDWQIDVLAQLLRTASSTTSTGPMLAQVAAGTRLFGPEGDERRRRTATLLVKAGMPIEAYAYLPPIDAARAAGDAAVMLGHARYHEGRAAAARGGDAERERREAFGLYAEVALLPPAADDRAAAAAAAAATSPNPLAGPNTTVNQPAADRRAGLDRAMDMLPEIPESIATPWLDEVFRREALAPAALEKIALGALTLADGSLDEAQRARTILIMRTAVQTLLSSDRVDREALRIPLRMLTTALVTEAEKLVAARPDPRRGDLLTRQKAMLLRAIPGQLWLDTIEDSLAVRAYRAFVGLATVSDETDLALDLLDQGIRRHPGQAALLADDFLANWTKRLRPNEANDQNAAMAAAFMFFGGRSSVPAAPLTRGRQARNLERLERVLAATEALGVDARALDNVVPAFRACHSQAEAFTAADIERVLGPIEELPGGAAAQLAGSMRSGLAGDWRSRETQQRFGMRRNASEIAAVVADGYAVAMRLIERAIADEPESWEHAITRAALAFDRLEHRRAMQGDDFAEYESLRAQSFDAFADAAARYAEVAAAGGIPPTIDVHLAWFNAAVGATQLDQLNRDNILYEGSNRDTQIDRIRASILAMDRAQAEEHMGLFVQQIVGSLTGVNPEVKPRLVKHALRVVGEHPTGAPLRRIAAVHDDLIQNEIALRLTIDGEDRVGAGVPFGAVLSLRYTNAVDRETDGFAKYLRNQVWVYFGNQGRTMDYRDRLERSIERSLDEGFEIESIAFFDPLFPSREVRERGESAWQEKPLAYIVMTARDPSTERIAPVQMDLDFIDTTGPIILAIESNAPVVDAVEPPARRPVRDLVVTQTLDARAMRESDEGRAITLEVRATGRGIVPDLDELLDGIRGAVDGYTIAEDGIESHPINVVKQGDATEDPFGFVGMSAAMPEEDAETPGPDDDGMYRTDFERSWTIRYVPASGAVGGEFRLPTLKPDVDGSLVSRHFDDLDVVTVAGSTVPLVGGGLNPAFVVMVVLLACGMLGSVIVMRRRGAAVAGAGSLDDLLPARATPLAAIAALQRIERDHGDRLDGTRRGELVQEIRELERRYFGPNAGAADDAGATNGEVRGVVERWAAAARG